VDETLDRFLVGRKLRDHPMGLMVPDVCSVAVRIDLEVVASSFLQDAHFSSHLLRGLASRFPTYKNSSLNLPSAR
jgi:hypothetical protein